MIGTAGDASKPAGAEGTEPAKSAAPSTTGGRSDASSAGIDRLGAKLEEETEADILLARKRREANDEYFQRVNNGVIDVVAKLDDVAKAMRSIEQESKDVWAESDAMTGSIKS
jgi:septum formation topological specificity factor MinE